jgi:hypothetical protein
MKIDALPFEQMPGGKSFNLRRAMTLLASLRIKITPPKPGEALMSDVRKGSKATV